LIAIDVEDFAEARDVLGKIAFFDERVLPDRRHHFVLAQDLTVVLDKHLQRLELLRR